MSEFTKEDLKFLYEGEFQALLKVAEDFVGKMTPEEAKHNLVLLLLGDMLNKRKALKESNEQGRTSNNG